MRQPLPRSALAALLLSLTAALAAALTAVPAFAVYKCEVDGATVYGDQPCAGGTRIETAAGVTAADVAEAKARAARQQALAAKIDGEHAKEEAAREKRMAQQAKADARAAQQKKAQCEALAQRAKWADEDLRAAAGPAATKAATRARRAAEQYEARCRN